MRGDLTAEQFLSLAQGLVDAPPVPRHGATAGEVKPYAQQTLQTLENLLSVRPHRSVSFDIINLSSRLYLLN